MRILDKQLGRVGLTRFDIASMTGDGGGENEGKVSGMHSILEIDVPGYVRRRCLGHLAWRIADSVIDEIPDYGLVKKLCEYINKGVTWTRLQALASAPVVDHGLGLFKEKSQQYKRMFSKAPRPIVDTRPESDKHFLLFLGGKEHVLWQTASRDVTDRNLSASTVEAVQILQHVPGRAIRRLSAEVLHRALFLHLWVNEHPHISGIGTLESLGTTASQILQDVSLDAATLQRLGINASWFVDRGWARPQTWLKAVALLEFEDEGLAEDCMSPLVQMHAKLVARGTSHLELLLHNIKRTAWLAGACLHVDAPRAQTSAQSLLLHLDTVAPDRRTPFEKHLVDSPDLWSQLQQFAHREPAVCLWQGQGAYRTLFQFVASRFLLAPDQVLDCERMHARWNWICNSKRGIRLPLLNAWVCLSQFLESHGMQFPTPELLQPHLAREGEAHAMARAEVRASEEIAPGFREQFMFLERFNLRAIDLVLDAPDPAPGHAALHLRTDYEETGSVYLRNTLMPRRFYLAPTLGRDAIWFYIVGNRVLGGREDRHDTDAQTRPLVVCFFEAAPGAADEQLVRRTDRQFAGMTTASLTPAELALHLGLEKPLAPTGTSLEIEALTEQAWLRLPRTCFSHQQLPLEFKTAP